MKKQILALASIVMIGGVMTFTSCKQDDITAPVVNVTGGNAQSQNLPSTAGAGTWTNPTATATDDEDGDVSSSITVTGTVDPNTAGSYTLTYTVSDAAGNTATETVTVSIVNSADFLERTYVNCHDTCQVTAPFNYTAIGTASNTVNGNFTINNFGGFGTSINVNAALSGSNISVGASQSLGGSASIVACSGAVTSTSPAEFGLTYTWTDGASNEVCISLYR
jgi:trimeric autotransporter adhesin